MAITSTGTVLSPVTDLLGSLGDLYSKVKIAEAQASTSVLEMQVQAMREQLATPYYDAQAMREPSQYDYIPGSGGGGLNYQAIAMAAVVAFGLYLAIKG